MATTITGGDLKLIADKAVSNSGEILLSAKAFSLGVNAEGLSKGDSTQVFVAGSAPDAEDYDAEENNYMTDNGGDHAWKSVTLDKHIKLSFHIAPDKFEKFTTDSLAALYKPYVSKVSDKIISDVFAVITAGNFPNAHQVANASAFTKSDAGKAETALAKLVGSGSARNLILGIDVFDALRDSLSGIYANPINNEILRNGSIPGICGFAEVIRTSAIKPVSSGTGLIGIATNMSGVALATAAVKQVPQFTGESEVSLAPETQIPLTFSVDYSKDTRSYIATVEALYGIAVLDKKGILRLTATAAPST